MEQSLNMVDVRPGFTAVPAGSPPTRGRALADAPGRLPKRVVVVGLLMVGAMAGVYFSPVRPFLQDSTRVREAMTALGPWSYPAVAVAVAILVACGVPRLLFCAVGGMALGFWWGLLLTQGGAILGYYAVFAFVRWGGREWVLHRWPRLRKWSGFLEGQGVVGVALIRQLPIHGTLTNLCLGLSRVRHRHFLLGTAIGVVPEAVPVTLVGAGLMRASLRDSAGYLAVAAVAFAVIWFACRHAVRVMRRTSAGAALMAEAESDAPATAPKGIDE